MWKALSVPRTPNQEDEVDLVFCKEALWEKAHTNFIRKLALRFFAEALQDNELLRGRVGEN
jgi:hypothetical protein